MPRRPMFLRGWALLLVFVFVLGAPPVAAQETMPRNRYLPVVIQTGSWSALPGTFATSITTQRQAASGAPSPVLRLYRFDGSLAYERTARYGETVYLSQALSVLPPGRYAGILSALGDAATVVTVRAADPTMAATYRALGPEEAGPSVVVPNVFKNYAGLYTSVISVQNTGTGPARVRVSYRDQNGDTIGSVEEQTVAANGFHDFAQALSPLPDNFVGSAVVSADQPVAAASHVANPAGELAGTTGVVGGGTRTDVPAVYKNYSADGWMSSLLVQNVDAAPARVRLTFRGPGLTDPLVLTDSIPSYASRQYWQGNQPAGLPDGFRGSATVESLDGQRVVAVVNTRNAAGNLSSYTAGAQQPTSGAYLPLLYNDCYCLPPTEGRFSSSLVVQNADPLNAAEVTIRYYWGSDLRRTVIDMLGPGESRLRYLPNEGLPSGFAGHAVVTSTGGRVVATANTAAVGGGAGDWLVSYEGSPIASWRARAAW